MIYKKSLMKIFRLASYLVLLLLFAISCRNTAPLVDNHLAEITVANAFTEPILASEMLSLEGFSLLEAPGDRTLRSIKKILFCEGKIIVLDNRTDFQQVLVFDEGTGRYLNSIGHQSEQEGGFHELYDIVLNPHNGGITGLVAGKMCFMTWDLSGNLLSVLPNGVFGQNMALLPNGGFLVYNEFGASDISGNYHLIVYDDKGNLADRISRYPESADGWGYDYTGFLTTCQKEIWYNPPFSDTIFTVSGERITPKYTLNFSGNEVPIAIRQKKLTGWDTDNNSFLCEGLVKTDRYALFHFYEQQKTSLGIYDDLNEKFYNARNFSEKDVLYPLIQVGDIFPKTDNSFALVLEPKRIRYLINKKKIDMDILTDRYPDLYRQLTAYDGNDRYLLLYFSTLGLGK